VLNTPPDKRQKTLDEQLAAFAYINGKLFEEMLPNAAFDSAMRQELLNCCALDWSRISPAIFGSLFQSIMDKAARRNLGAHYTRRKHSQTHQTAFLDKLREELKKSNTHKPLLEFHKKIKATGIFWTPLRLRQLSGECLPRNRLLELDILRASKIYQSEMSIHR
jgi:hypothetical protein